MSRAYRVEHSPDAAASRKAMSEPLRTRFDTGMRDIADDPFTPDSSAVRGEQDRRDATVAGVAVRYYVGRAIRTVTVVRAIWVEVHRSGY